VVKRHRRRGAGGVLAAVGIAAACAWSCSPSRAQAPVLQEIPCTLDAGLSGDAPLPHPSSVAEDGPFADRARWLEGGRLLVERESPGEYSVRIRMELELRPPDVPRAWMSACVVDRSTSLVTPHTDLEGTVVVSSDGAALRSGGAEPLVVLYDVEGPCAGSPVRRVGRIVLRASEIESR
jgi:hypothetical protein